MSGMLILLLIVIYVTAKCQSSLLYEQWGSYFQSCLSVTCCSELFKIYFNFASLHGLAANVERAFSLINAQWTKKRNRLTDDYVRKF